MDQVTLDRIKLMHPSVRNEVFDMYTYANNKLLGKGVRLRFAYTLRTNKEQDDLYAQGRTKLYDGKGNRLGIVTKAKGGQSIHNYGLALDIVLLVDKDKDGTFETASWDITRDFDGDGVADWTEIANYFKSKGWEWGGDWNSFKDYPHFQKDFGYTWSALQSKFTSGQTTDEVINGVTYKWVKL